MSNRGMNHFGLITQDIDKTIEFYHGVLGFEPVAYYIRDINGGHIRQVFFDLGDGQSLEFAQPHNMDGISEQFDAGMNDGLGVTAWFSIVGPIHFAFRVDSIEDLAERQAAVKAAGVETLGPLDLDWMHSFYFTDPVNGIQLEYAVTREEGPGKEYLEPVSTDLWKSLAEDARAKAT